MICREAKGIKVLSYGDDREEIVVMLVYWGGKSGFYEFARYRDRMIGLVMQTSRYGRDDIWRSVRPTVSDITSAIDFNLVF